MVASSAFAQAVPDIPDTAKDYSDVAFNWQQKHWLLNSFQNSDYGEVIRVLSPFYSEDTTKFPFANGGNESIVPDFFPEEGWELVSRNMGFNKEGKVKTHKDYSYPYLVLYNRARGVARVIAYINHAPYTFNSIEISLSSSVAGNQGKRVNLFSTYKPTGLVDSASYPVKATALAPLYAHDSGQFIYGDIPITFDPCAALAPYNLDVKIAPVQDATLVLGGKQMSTDVPVVRGGQYMDDGLLASYLKDGNNLDIDNLGVLTYNNYSQMVNQMDTERFAKAVYKEEGDETLDTMVKIFQAGFKVGSTGATMMGVPVAPGVLSAASEGLNYLNFTPTRTLDGFKLPEPSSYLSIGELALKGNARVESSVRTMSFPLWGSKDSAGKLPGLFNLIEVPTAEVFTIEVPGTGDYSYIADDGYTIKGAAFWNDESEDYRYRFFKGPILSFNLQQLGGVLSPLAEKNGYKVLVGLEARTQTTQAADGQVIDKNQPKKVCGYFKCAEDEGLTREVVSSDLVEFDQWESSFGLKSVNFSLPKLSNPSHSSTSEYTFRNFNLNLKVWLVPKHLMEDYQGDISSLSREELAASAQMLTYPIKLNKVTFPYRDPRIKTAYAMKVKEKGGFAMLPQSIRKESARSNPFRTNTNLRTRLNSSELAKMCPVK